MIAELIWIIWTLQEEIELLEDMLRMDEEMIGPFLNRVNLNHY